jgi:acetoacetyl-CoA synthetase
VPLFVVLRGGLAPGAAMKQNINRAFESESSRFLPHEVFAMQERSARIVRQKAGRCDQDVAIRSSDRKNINVNAIANPACLDWWVAFAGKFRQS